MKINVTNTSAVNKAISEVEGKSYQRTMKASQVNKLIKKLESTLTIIAPKKEWCGSEFILTNGTEVPASYFGVAKSTFVSIKHFSSGWFITKIERLAIKSRDIYPVKVPSLSKSKLHRLNMFN
jgi:hypothetical protein